MTAVDRVRAAYQRVREVDRPEVWITLRAEDEVLADAARIDDRVAAGGGLALAGQVFAVKNNIDVAGIETTAACPAYGYQPSADATAVGRLRDAGAVVIGSTNLDQFATGLVGVRSPYGAVRNAIDPSRISGGSSSGSGAAVGLGVVDFALGTDTAGSGRVPAALHGIYGIKPTVGLVPATGVVPACRSIDVVTVMDTDLDRALLVARSMAGPDGVDRIADRPAVLPIGPVRRIGVVGPAHLGELAGGWASAYDQACAAWERRGFETVQVGISGLLAAARLLYDGAYVAERYAAVGEFVTAHPDEVDPTVGGIITRAAELPAWQLFRDLDALREYRRGAAEMWRSIDALLLPTTTEHPTIDAVRADPVAINSRMGRFTNFVNLLDMAALAYPAGVVDGLPFGVQLIGPAFSDELLGTAVATVTSHE